MTEKPAADDKDRRDAADEDGAPQAPRPKSAEEVQREAAEHDRRVRRFLLRLSLANWGAAAIAWMISAYLGITSPASIFVYSVLFVIGLVAAIVAIVTYLLEKFGHEPPPVLGEDATDRGMGEEARGGDQPLPTAGPAATVGGAEKTGSREDAASATPPASRPVAPGTAREGGAGREPASAPPKGAPAPPPSSGASASHSKGTAAGGAPAPDGNAPPPVQR